MHALLAAVALSFAIPESRIKVVEPDPNPQGIENKHHGNGY
jgi:hypothetical protein